MTSQLRRKRPTTARNTARARAIELAGARGLAWCLAVGLGFGSLAVAGENVSSTSAASKKLWHARGVPAKTVIEPAPTEAEVVPAAAEPPRLRELPPVDAPVATVKSPPGLRQLPPVDPPATTITPRRLPIKSTRSKLRDAVMQVSSSEPDPFGDEKSSDTLPAPDDARLPTAEEPAMTEPEPAPLPSNADPFADEPIPSPPRQTEELLPPGDLSEGLSTPGTGFSCKGYNEECLRAIADLQQRDITKIVVGLVIDGVEGEDFPCDCKLGGNIQAPVFQGRHWSRTNFAWKATGTCHKPLYFEDVQLERYGHSWNPVLQPFMSAGHFFVSVPLLPYKMGLNPPGECMYTLGYYRPGNCAPYVLEPIPFSLRGTVFEVFGATAFAFWFWPPG